MPESPGTPEDLVDLAFTLAVRDVDDTGGPLIPFVLMEGPEGRALHRIMNGGDQDVDLELAVQQARWVVSQSQSPRAAIAWDGYLTDELGRLDALYVEVFDRGMTTSACFALRYAISNPGTMAVIGGPERLPGRPSII